MIKYPLQCKTCNSIFDSWFASSTEFEKLKKMNLINCETCNSFKIDKSVMSPRISSNLNSSKEKNTAKVNEVKSDIFMKQDLEDKKIKKYKKNVTDTLNAKLNIFNELKF